MSYLSFVSDVCSKGVPYTSFSCRRVSHGDRNIRVDIRASSIPSCITRRFRTCDMTVTMCYVTTTRLGERRDERDVTSSGPSVSNSRTARENFRGYVNDRIKTYAWSVATVICVNGGNRRYVTFYRKTRLWSESAPCAQTQVKGAEGETTSAS